MRAVIWFVLLFVVAVVAATTLGGNDGLVSIYWVASGSTSRSTFLILLAVLCALLVTAFNAINALVGLPQRARGGASRGATAPPRPRCARRSQRNFGGRYSRAQKEPRSAP